MKPNCSIALLLVGLAFVPAIPAMAEDFVFHHEHVLGTSLEIRMNVADEEQAHRLESIALTEIDRLSMHLSNYDANSEFRKWQQDPKSSQRLHSVSVDLRNVLERSEYWRKVSDGAFDARAEALTQMWRTAKSKQQLPSNEERNGIVSQIRGAAWHMVDDQVQLDTTLPLTLDGLAKGYIIDCAIEKIVAECPDVHGLLINIGGDLRVAGNQPMAITIENPYRSSENDSGIETITISNARAMATSGDYRRFFEIQGRAFSHIVDPRTGFTANNARSVSVLANTAIDADAAATALSVLPTEEAIDLIESMESMACLIVERNGRVVTSSRWPNQNRSDENNAVRLVGSMDDKDKSASKADEGGLDVKFSIKKAEGRRYRRPYVAVWLEDKDNFPVKTAVLWLQTSQPGPRWHRDLTRWFRGDKTRKATDEKDLIGTLSGATRGPGEYEAHFDGTDNHGKPLVPGKYSLCLEVAREHGSYQLIRETFEWGDKPIAKTELKNNPEMTDVSFQFTPVVAK